MTQPLVGIETIYVSISGNTVTFNPSSITVPPGCNQIVTFQMQQGAAGTLSAVTADSTAVPAQFMYLNQNTNTDGNSPTNDVTVSVTPNGQNTPVNGVFTINNSSGPARSGYNGPEIPSGNLYGGVQYVYVNFQFNNGAPTFAFVPPGPVVVPENSNDGIVWILDPNSSPGATLAGVSMGLGTQGQSTNVPWSGAQPQMGFVATDVNAVAGGTGNVTYEYTCQVSYNGTTYSSPDPEVVNEAPPT